MEVDVSGIDDGIGLTARLIYSKTRFFRCPPNDRGARLGNDSRSVILSSGFFENEQAILVSRYFAQPEIQESWQMINSRIININFTSAERRQFIDTLLIYHIFEKKRRVLFE